MYKQTIEERGYVEVPYERCSIEQQRKWHFVFYHLSKTLKNSNCGWNNLEYKVMKTPSGIRTEFLVLWAEAVGKSGSRWINVTGNSLGAIMCAMCENLW
jgi:hypothetical protein